MKFKNKIILSNIIMVTVPLVLALLMWGAFSAFNIKNYSGSSADGTHLADMRLILGIYESGIRNIHWKDLEAEPSKTGLNEKTAPGTAKSADDTVKAAPVSENTSDSAQTTPSASNSESLSSTLQTIQELGESGFRFNVARSGATFFSNFPKKDLTLVRYISSPSINIEENRALIRQIIRQDGTSYAVTALYDKSLADTQVHKSLLPIYSVPQNVLLIFMAIVASIIIALNYLLTSYLTKAANLERQVLNISEMARTQNAEVLASVNGELLVPDTFTVKENVSQESERECISYHELRILKPEHKVTVRGKVVELKNKEFELLCFLAQNPGIVFSKDTLYDRVWGSESYGETATVAVHINRLREKIEADPAAPEYIFTVWGAGYKFAGE